MESDGRPVRSATNLKLESPSPAIDVLADTLRAGVELRIANGRLEGRNFENVNNQLRERLRAVRDEINKLTQSCRLELWSFRRLEIPSQIRPGYVDVWMLGDSGCKQVIWFAGTKVQEEARGMEG